MCEDVANNLHDAQLNHGPLKLDSSRRPPNRLIRSRRPFKHAFIPSVASSIGTLRSHKIQVCVLSSFPWPLPHPLLPPRPPQIPYHLLPPHLCLQLTPLLLPIPPSIQHRLKPRENRGKDNPYEKVDANPESDGDCDVQCEDGPRRTVSDSMVTVVARTLQGLSGA